MSASSMFKPASKSHRRLKLAFCAPSGFGKTWFALETATGICERIRETTGKDARVAVIDSENGSSELYQDDFDFHILRLKNDFDPQIYVDAIREGERHFDVIVVDSLSHAWSGPGGILDKTDEIARRSSTGNSFAAWRFTTPIHNLLVDTMIRCSSHLIVTMRSKVDYVLEDGPGGKKTPRKVGLAPIQREGMEYEFDIVMDINSAHEAVPTKTRYRPIDGRTVGKSRWSSIGRRWEERPAFDLGKELAGWLEGRAPAASEAVAVAEGLPTGQPAPAFVPPTLPAPVPAPIEATPSPTPSDPNPPATADQVSHIYDLFADANMTDAQVAAALSKRGVGRVDELTAHQAEELIGRLAPLAAQAREAREDDAREARAAQARLEGATAVEQIALRIEGATPEEAAALAGARPADAIAPVVVPESARSRKEREKAEKAAAVAASA